MIQVWVLTVIFTMNSYSNSFQTDKYVFKTRDECIKASKFYRNATSGLSVKTSNTLCYPSYVPSK